MPLSLTFPENGIILKKKLYKGDLFMKHKKNLACMLLCLILLVGVAAAEEEKQLPFISGSGIIFELVKNSPVEGTSIPISRALSGREISNSDSKVAIQCSTVQGNPDEFAISYWSIGETGLELGIVFEASNITNIVLTLYNKETGITQALSAYIGEETWYELYQFNRNTQERLSFRITEEQCYNFESRIFQDTNAFDELLAEMIAAN